MRCAILIAALAASVQAVPWGGHWHPSWHGSDNGATTTTDSGDATTTTVASGGGYSGGDGSMTTTAASASTPTGYSSGGTSSSGNDYIDTVVNTHNTHRAHHSAPDIQWDDALASDAQQIAATCTFAHSMNVGGGNYGQNIAMGVSNVADVITGQWYNEVSKFQGLFGQAEPDMSDFEGWGHFTQVVWKSSTKVGCATQNCPGLDGSTYTVCNYGPPGNYDGEYAQNVGAPTS